MNEQTQIQIELLKMQHARYLLEAQLRPDNYDFNLMNACGCEGDLCRLLAALLPSLTLREEVTLRLLAGLVADPSNNATYDVYVKTAFSFADAFLAHGKPQSEARGKEA